MFSKPVSIGCLLVVISFASIAQSLAAEQGPFELGLDALLRKAEEDRLIIGLSKAREAEMIRVTEKPHHVSNLSTLCGLPPDGIPLLVMVEWIVDYSLVIGGNGWNYANLHTHSLPDLRRQPGAITCER